MGSLLNISLFVIATVIAVCYVIYSLIVAYQSSVKLSKRYHKPLLLTYLPTYLLSQSTGSNETRDIEDSQDALFGLFYFLIFIIALNRLRFLYYSLNSLIVHSLTCSYSRIGCTTINQTSKPQLVDEL